MAKGKRSDTEEAQEPTAAPSFEFQPIPGMIRLIRRPFDLGAPKYSFKSVLGITANGRTIKKPVAPSPVPNGAGWEEWLMQDNDGNRAVIETGYRDAAFCYTPIYPNETDAVGKLAKAVKSYVAQLEKACETFDARFQKIQAETETIQAEIEALMNGGLTEEENKKLEDLNKRDEALRSDRFEAEKAFRLCKSRIKSQKDLLERLG